MLKTIFHFLTIIVICLALMAAFIFKPAFIGSGRVGVPASLIVSATSTPSSIAHDLEAQGVIDWSMGYELYAKIDSATKDAKPGRYQIQAGSSYRSIARRLAEGPQRSESQLTIIEGWTVDDEASYLEEQKQISLRDTHVLAGASVNKSRFEPQFRDQYLFLKELPNDRSLEGYLFPDTYRVWDDELPEGLLRKQLGEFEKRFGEQVPGPQSAPLKTLDDVVILASIIEKEVPHPQDRKRIAGIFLNRLRAGMPLQTDASLAYLTNSNHTQATAQDLALDSPFNTYKYKGLPPAPISNPGASAIEAVLNPEQNDYFFFLTDQNGQVLYAKTLEEHQKNRQKAGY